MKCSFHPQGMNLQQIDLKALYYLFNLKIARIDQLNRDVYCGYHVDSVARRLRHLENNRLIIGRRNRMLSNGKKLLSISKKGFELFIKKENENRIELTSDATEHDLTLVDIRHKFMQSKKVVEYYTENNLQTWGSSDLDHMVANFVDLSPDALMLARFTQDEVWLPIEYEATLKTKKRYDQIVEKYFQSSDSPIILYIAKSENIIRTIVKAEEKLYPNDQPRFFCTLYKDFLESEAIQFEDRFNNSLVL